MIPDIVDGEPVLRTQGPAVERTIDQWAAALDGKYESAGEGVKDLRTWMDRYDPDHLWSDASRTSRYRYHLMHVDGVEGAVLDPGCLESDYDPYDESIEGGRMDA